MKRQPRMKRNCKMAAGVMVFMLAAAMGCGSGQEAENVNTVLPAEDKADENMEQPDQSSEAEVHTSGSTVPDTGQTDNGENSDSSIPAPLPENSSESQVSDMIGGKVRSVAQDSFVLSRVLMEDSMVVIPEAGSPEEELVTVRCTDSTTFECWTIQGGGADIVVGEAAFSDIREDGGLEAEGYFEGEEFVAERVIIEIYE